MLKAEELFRSDGLCSISGTAACCSRRLGHKYLHQLDQEILGSSLCVAVPGPRLPRRGYETRRSSKTPSEPDTLLQITQSTLLSVPVRHFHIVISEKAIDNSSSPADLLSGTLTGTVIRRWDLQHDRSLLALESHQRYILV